MQLIGVPERKKKKKKVVEEIFKDIIEENIPELKKIVKICRKKGLMHLPTVCIVFYKCQLDLNG